MILLELVTRYSESFKPGRMFHFGGSTGGLVTAAYQKQ